MERKELIAAIVAALEHASPPILEIVLTFVAKLQR